MLDSGGLESARSAEVEASAELVRRARAGDLAAFERLMVLHERPVFATALRLLGRREDAQDATQEVFLRLHKQLARFDDIRQLSPWLYRVTVNVCRDLYRSRQDARILPLDQVPAPAVAVDPLADLTAAERKQIVAQGLRTLADKERTALVLRDIEGLSTREVARILGTREATVRVQVARARLKLRKFAQLSRKGQS